MKQGKPKRIVDMVKGEDGIITMICYEDGECHAVYTHEDFF